MRKPRGRNEALWISVYMLPFVLLFTTHHELVLSSLAIAVLAGGYATGAYMLVRGRDRYIKVLVLAATVALAFAVNHYYNAVESHVARNGVKTEHYESGGLKSRMRLINGLRHGPWQAWHRNGKVSERGYYLNDIATGRWSYYSEYGTKAMEGVYAGNERCGLWRTWYRDGKLQMSGVYAGDRWNGWWKLWHENGRLAAAGWFTDGEEEGRWMMRNPERNLMVVRHYKEGVTQSEMEYEYR